MEQILLTYGLPKKTVSAIMIIYRNTKVKVRSPDGDTNYFNIVAEVLQGDTLAPYLLIICLDYVLRTSIDKIRENGFELTKKRSRFPQKRLPTPTTLMILRFSQMHPSKPKHYCIVWIEPPQALTSMSMHTKRNICTGDISTLGGSSLKLVDKFTYLGSSVSSTGKYIDTRLANAWTANDSLSVIWKSNLTDKMKRSFFQAAIVSILLYGCTTWTLTKQMDKRLDGNYTRVLRAILNKSWRQHPTKQQLYGHLSPITKTIQVRRNRHAGRAHK